MDNAQLEYDAWLEVYNQLLQQQAWAQDHRPRLAEAYGAAAALAAGKMVKALEAMGVEL